MKPRSEPTAAPALCVTFVDREALVARARQAAERVEAERWALAELALALEHALGPEPRVRRALMRQGASPAALAAAAGLSVRQLARLRRTAQAFGPRAREATLSFDHHALLAASLPEPSEHKARKRWLKLASREGLTVAQLARRLAAERLAASPRAGGRKQRACQTKRHGVR